MYNFLYKMQIGGNLMKDTDSTIYEIRVNKSCLVFICILWRNRKFSTNLDSCYRHLSPNFQTGSRRS